MVMRFILFLFLWAFVGCDSWKEKGSGNEALLASVGGVPFTGREWEYERSLDDSARSEVQWKDRLEQVLLEEAIYQKAKSENFFEDPEAHHALRQLVSQLYMRKGIEAVSGEPSEKEIEDYYGAHRTEFERGEQVKVADIFIKKKPDLKEDAFAQKVALVWEKAKLIEGKPFGFGELIQEFSDENFNYPIGKTGYFDETGSPVSLSKKMVEVSFALKKIGEVSVPIEESEGTHIVMLVGRRPALSRPLAMVGPEIKVQLRQEKWKMARESWIMGIKAAKPIVIQEDAFALLTKDLMPSEKKEFPEKNQALSPPHLK